MKTGEDMIAKFLAGEATPEQAMELMDWRAASPENEAVFLHCEAAWQRHGIDWKQEKEKSWAAIKRATTPARFLMTPVLRWAAVFVFAAIGGMWLYRTLMHNRPPATEQVVRSATAPLRAPLSDGTKVTLNKSSEVRYPAAFANGSRQVKLSGEAFFEVTPDKARPFIITCDEVAVKVVGTSFQVSNRTGYRIAVQVREGVVIMYTPVSSITVRAGWTGLYDKATKSFSLIKPATFNNLAYATHSFEFEQAELKDVFNDLEEAYGVHFVFENERLKNCRLTSQLRDQPLDFVLRVISESLSIQCRTEGNTVYISGDGCQ